jgi:hypothetical protein
MKLMECAASPRSGSYAVKARSSRSRRNGDCARLRRVAAAAPPALTLLALWAANAAATELHFDCARTNESAKVDIDIDRRFLQIMWSEGVAEEFLNGDSYISGPDSFGEKQKVTFVLEVAKNVVTFGADRACLQSGSKRECEDQSSRNTLDLASGEMKYDEGDTVAILHCAPVSRRF